MHREISRNDREDDHGEKGEEGEESEEGKENKKDSCSKKDCKEVRQESGKEDRCEARSGQEGQGSGQESESPGQEAGRQEGGAQKGRAQEGSGLQARRSRARAETGYAEAGCSSSAETCHTAAAKARRCGSGACAQAVRSTGAATARISSTVPGARTEAGRAGSLACRGGPDGAAPGDATRSGADNACAAEAGGTGSTLVSEPLAFPWARLDQLERHITRGPIAL